MEWLIGLRELAADVGGHLRSGGLVMLPLVALSLWMWLLIFKKQMEIQAWKRERLPLANCVILLEEEAPFPESWHGRMMADFRERRTGDAKADGELLRELMRRRLAGLEKSIPTIVVLASIAPLLGLLGTVSGMIATFDVISRFGTGNAKAMASGISEALVTTQSGLVVAIPGLFMGNVLSRRVERFRGRMERFCLHFSRICQEEAERSS